jgi:hypothetical protein
MRAHLPRALAVLVNLIAQHNKEKFQTPDLREQGNVVTRANTIFLEFRDIRGEECNMRYLVPDLAKLRAQHKFFIIGFFSHALETSSVIKQIWELDDKLVNAIPSFEGILAYL